jgi:hypothetical protein
MEPAINLTLRLVGRLSLPRGTHRLPFPSHKGFGVVAAGSGWFGLAPDCFEAKLGSPADLVKSLSHLGAILTPDCSLAPDCLTVFWQCQK